MPEQFSKELTSFEANLPEFTQGELWTMVILAAAIVAACLFLLLKART